MSDCEENCLPFGDYAEDLCKEQQNDGRKKASKQERLDLLNFIGGFEKWSELDEDCRRHVVQFLDYWTRCHLSLCSISDYELVKNTALFTSREQGIRLKPQNLKTLDNGIIKAIKIKHHFVEIETSTGYWKSWNVLRGHRECRILSKTFLKNKTSFSNVLTIPNGDFYEEVAKMVKKVLDKGNETVEDLEIISGWNIETSWSWDFPNLKRLKLIYQSDEKCRFWLSNIKSEPLDEFYFDRSYHWFDESRRGTSFDLLDYPLVVNAKHLQLYESMDVSEEKLRQITSSARMIRMFLNFVTQTFLVDLVEKWINGELNEEFSFFNLHTLDCLRGEVRDLIRERLEATEYNYTDRTHPRRMFFKSFERFFNIHGNYFEVRSAANRYDILSVIITPRCFAMVRTGFHFNDGQFSSTEFKVPDLSENRLKLY